MQVFVTILSPASGAGSNAIARLALLEKHLAVGKTV
jgi:hypothetical protein